MSLIPDVNQISPPHQKPLPVPRVSSVEFSVELDSAPEKQQLRDSKAGAKYLAHSSIGSFLKKQVYTAPVFWIVISQ